MDRSLKLTPGSKLFRHVSNQQCVAGCDSKMLPKQPAEMSDIDEAAIRRNFLNLAAGRLCVSQVAKGPAQPTRIDVVLQPTGICKVPKDGCA